MRVKLRRDFLRLLDKLADALDALWGTLSRPCHEADRSSRGVAVRSSIRDAFVQPSVRASGPQEAKVANLLQTCIYAKTKSYTQASEPKTCLAKT